MPSNSSTPLNSNSPRSPLSSAVTPAMIPSGAYVPPMLHLTPLPSPSLRAIGATANGGYSKGTSSDPLPTVEQSYEVTTMPEVRHAIDRLDEEIVSLLAIRLRYIEAAARIKEDKTTVRDEWRKQDVISKAVRKAKEVNFDPTICAQVYEALVEGCIEYEEVKWRDVRGLNNTER
ncbi:hypothetical protein DFH27DRAFT_497358 [Peziza echinospora]|nr:hypothetical protein DFH27DRAFT_497358 [Peziza echinospora]